MNLKERVGVIGRACVNYAIQQPDKKLSKLSPKKRTGLECMVYSIEKIKSLTMDIKKNWFGWCYYTVRMIKDSEVDQLVLSGHYAAETYIKLHWANEFVASFEDPQKKKMAQALTRTYRTINGQELETNPIVKEFQAYVI